MAHKLTGFFVGIGHDKYGQHDDLDLKPYRDFETLSQLFLSYGRAGVINYVGMQGYEYTIGTPVSPN
jgi:hypothetical protein